MQQGAAVMAVPDGRRRSAGGLRTVATQHRGLHAVLEAAKAAAASQVGVRCRRLLLQRYLHKPAKPSRCHRQLLRPRFLPWMQLL